MRRAVLIVLVGCALLSPLGAAAKSGIGKTRGTEVKVVEGGTVRLDRLSVGER